MEPELYRQIKPLITHGMTWVEVVALAKSYDLANYYTTKQSH